MLRLEAGEIPDSVSSSTVGRIWRPRGGSAFGVKGMFQSWCSRCPSFTAQNPRREPVRGSAHIQTQGILQNRKGREGRREGVFGRKVYRRYGGRQAGRQAGTYVRYSTPPLLPGAALQLFSYRDPFSLLQREPHPPPPPLLKRGACVCYVCYVYPTPLRRT